MSDGGESQRLLGGGGEREREGAKSSVPSLRGKLKGQGSKKEKEDNSSIEMKLRGNLEDGGSNSESTRYRPMMIVDQQSYNLPLSFELQSPVREDDGINIGQWRLLTGALLRSEAVDAPIAKVVSGNIFLSR
jgi:hypothetical protein